MVEYKLFDNGGTSIDRYTLIVDGDVIGMSSNALSAQGVNCYLFQEESVSYSDLGIRIELEDLPLEVYEAVMNRLNTYEGE